nr:acyl carrier protein [Gracilariopsis chorda]
MSSAQSEQSILDKVKNIVAEQLHVDLEKIEGKSTFIELGADSLDTVELVMAIEDGFCIDIPDEDAEEIKTLDQAVEFIEKAVEGSKS